MKWESLIGLVILAASLRSEAKTGQYKAEADCAWQINYAGLPFVNPKMDRKESDVIREVTRKSLEPYVQDWTKWGSAIEKRAAAGNQAEAILVSHLKKDPKILESKVIPDSVLDKASADFVESTKTIYGFDEGLENVGIITPSGDFFKVAAFKGAPADAQGNIGEQNLKVSAGKKSYFLNVGKKGGRAWRSMDITPGKTFREVTGTLEAGKYSPLVRQILQNRIKIAVASVAGPESVAGIEGALINETGTDRSKTRNNFDRPQLMAAIERCLKDVRDFELRTTLMQAVVALVGDQEGFHPYAKPPAHK
jgi:hypothetical protein